MISLLFPDKPPLEDLQYFLEFQIPRVWAPEQSSLQRKEPVSPSLQFSLMGPKLLVSPQQVKLICSLIFLFCFVLFIFLAEPGLHSCRSSVCACEMNLH